MKERKKAAINMLTQIRTDANDIGDSHWNLISEWDPISSGRCMHFVRATLENVPILSLSLSLSGLVEFIVFVCCSRLIFGVSFSATMNANIGTVHTQSFGMHT